ncbi:MAG: threonine--tRNA ligase [Candidatus Woykebacteria bacterium GWB1_45_5]|uniref:Threonine--tRNA ligase n=2 Tax=Candidatus Woykeibacteriota TaxID=1817899 RepID=A0A1G1W3U0_9BACT|nr:MAG: threonine--tRNA ligase [Candidatus Woykebacteria bacterium GWA1_44_8]OGY24482.1 MAG: threonine--tRNA ligase [Candidatus Woykebacteria bacterium GWB1_45_5]
MKIDLSTMRHSTAHLMAAAVESLWPKTKFGIGPTIENGFYYDFDLPEKISEEDLPKIKKKMQELKRKNFPFERSEMGIEAALRFEKKRGQNYKSELIEQIRETGNTALEDEETPSKLSAEKKEVNKVTYYKLGSFIDLCRGPHAGSTSQIGEFKLLNIAGAYWRGSENNPMLTRIYGTVWPSEKELKDHLWQLDEAKRRDHKKIGSELDLFMFHETSPGMPYWLPKGLVIFNELVNFWRKHHEKHGYQEISTPLISTKALWETSGHWKFYKDEMFLIGADKNTYGVKAMNCPNAMVVFGSKTRSYKDLPLRLSDTDVLHRFEKSGTLNGLLRTRRFQQDDAHVFITVEQIAGEYSQILKIAEHFYSLFDLGYRLRFGTRPEKFLGDKKVWDKAEDELKKVLEKSNKEYFILEGDGAFYGPKIDILMKDAIGREWQMGTIQLDFQLPARFKLKYTDQSGRQKTPVVIHRVIYGSFERFIGILIEHYAGAFPTWLAPIQAVIIPIAERHTGYAENLKGKLTDFGIRAQVDSRAETMQAKIRDAQLQKIPYMLVVGDKEQVQDKVAVRSRDKGDEGTVSYLEFVDRIKNEIKEYK